VLKLLLHAVLKLLLMLLGTLVETVLWLWKDGLCLWKDGLLLKLRWGTPGAEWGLLLLLRLLRLQVGDGRGRMMIVQKTCHHLLNLIHKLHPLN
jgi:hypothetical protein